MAAHTNPSTDPQPHPHGDHRRAIRRLAMQVLYQMDVTGQRERVEILEAMDDTFDPPAVREQAVDLALAAWADHAAADQAVNELTADWPTHRQPPVDRAILRLAYHEMAVGRSPVKVAINEAVELSKQYAAENSPAFVNGVLDKIAKKLPAPATASPAEPLSCDPWLADALKSSESTVHIPEP